MLVTLTKLIGCSLRRASHTISEVQFLVHAGLFGAMMQRRPIALPLRPYYATVKVACFRRNHRNRFSCRRASVQLSSNSCFSLFGSRYRLTKPRKRQWRCFVSASKTSVTDGAWCASLSVSNPKWRESTAPEPSPLLVRTDLDPSSPPELFGSAEFEVETSQGPLER